MEHNYYRLSQTDYDGTSESFEPIVVTCESAPIDGYSVYPNPADGLLNIDIELENYQGDDVSIEVIDINGKIIQLQQVQLNERIQSLGSGLIRNTKWGIHDQLCRYERLHQRIPNRKAIDIATYYIKNTKPSSEGFFYTLRAQPTQREDSGMSNNRAS